MAGYVRNDTPNNIADGNIINASDLDGEFDTLQSAFGATGGHSHSGAVGEGKPVEKLGPAQDFSVSSTAATPKTNNVLDLGATSFKFKDAFFAGKVDTGTITLGGTAITATAAEVNKLAGVTATTAEINKLAGATSSTTELNYVTGVTSSIQTQLGTKQATITGAATTVTGSNLAINAALVSDAAGKIAVHPTVSSTELGYLDGVTSALQTQLGTKQATITGAATTITSSDLTISRALTSDAFGKVAVSAVTSTELGYVSGVTSAIQTQIGTKQATITGAATTITSSDLTASKALTSNASGKVVVSAVTDTELAKLSGLTATTAELNVLSGIPAGLTATELGYVDGVTSSIQTQFGNKAPLASPAFTGQASFPDGTAAAPSIAHTGDLNAGIFFPAADTVAITTSGAEAMRIDASGNVGVATSSPASKLDVFGTVRSITQSVPSSGSGVELFYNAGTGYVLSYDRTGSAYLPAIIGGSTLNLQTGGTSRIYADASGNVGIGTSSPSNKLEVFGNSTSVTQVIRNQSTTNATGAAVAIGANNGAQQAQLVTNYNTGGSNFNITSFASIPTIYIDFDTQVFRNSAGTERMRIGSAGQIGIGGANYGTSGQVLTSGGSGAAPSWADTGGMTLLGTLTTTSGSSQSLTGLTLTNYKQLVLEFNGVSHSSGTGSFYSLGSGSFTSNLLTASNAIYGVIWVSLVTGIATGVLSTGGSLPRAAGDGYNSVTGYSTATTTVTLSVSNPSFDAGSVKVYGVK